MVKRSSIKNLYSDKTTSRLVKPGVKQTRQRSKRRAVRVLLVLFIISISLTAYLRIKEANQNNESLDFNISSATEISAGKEISYFITYTNLEKVSLTKINLTLNYPSGFYFNEASLAPANDGKNYWQLPDLAAGYTANLEIRGVLVGEIGEVKTTKAIMAYEPANFSSTFSSSVQLEQVVANNLVDMWIDYPNEAMPAQDLLFKIHILNHLTDNFLPLQVFFDKPEQFSILEMDPAMVNNSFWEIVGLEPEAEFIITIRGELPPELSMNSLDFNTRVYQVTTDKKQLLDEDELIVVISRPNIKVSLIYADGPNAQVVNWGETINYQLSITNEGDYVPVDMKLLLVLDNNFINWQTWQDSEGLHREDNKIIWTKGNPKIGVKLDNLQPGEEINLKIGAKLQSAPIDAESINPKDLFISAVAKIEAPIGSDKYVATSDILTARIGQDIEFIAQLKYYDSGGELRGSGPIPPQVDQETIYVVDWELFAGLNNWQDLKIKTTLPPQVIWIASESDVTSIFDVVTRDLKINATELKANQSLSSSFSVMIKPTINQVGQLITLINPLTLTAVNIKTNESISQRIDSITSDLLYDPVVQGQGRVVD